MTGLETGPGYPGAWDLGRKALSDAELIYDYDSLFSNRQEVSETENHPTIIPLFDGASVRFASQTSKQLFTLV